MGAYFMECDEMTQPWWDCFLAGLICGWITFEVIPMIKKKVRYMMLIRRLKKKLRDAQHIKASTIVRCD